MGGRASFPPLRARRLPVPATAVELRAPRLRPAMPGDLRVRGPEHRVDEEPDERDDEHPDRPPRLGRTGQVRPPEHIDHRAHPHDEEEYDRRRDEDPPDHFSGMTLRRRAGSGRADRLPHLLDRLGLARRHSAALRVRDPIGDAEHELPVAIELVRRLRRERRKRRTQRLERLRLDLLWRGRQPEAALARLRQLTDQRARGLLVLLLEEPHERAHLTERVGQVAVADGDEHPDARHALLHRLPLLLREVGLGRHRASFRSRRRTGIVSAGAQSSWCTASATTNPTVVTTPTGIIVSASIVRIAPAANASTNATTFGEECWKSPYPAREARPETSAMAIHIQRILARLQPLAARPAVEEMDSGRLEMKTAVR